jgi:phosphate:Na+ symporter
MKQYNAFASGKCGAPRLATVLGFGILSVIFASSVLAASMESSDIAWGAMTMELLGGLALFLFGMEQMADALKSVAGERMKQILATLTTSRIMGLLTGAFVTAIIQSSSVTTVMLVGFVSANLMSLSQAVGVILGADIGTTITAQIVAFKVTKYALVLVSAGFLLLFTGKTERIKQYGHLIMGLGMIFFGMGLMSEAMKPLRTYEPFIEMMGNVSNPVVGILVATAFTGLIQSSSATMGVVIALALQGLVSLEGGIALALGANIGTCVTAALASIGKPREAVRVAVAHVTFKVAGVLIVIWFIPSFADLVRAVSPVAAPELSGVDKLAAETPRQIANAHTIFNVGLALLFLPVVALFARFCEWVVPDAPLAERTDIVRPKYLAEELLATPSLALDRVRLEVLHMGEHIQTMLRDVMPAIYAGDRKALLEVENMDERVDILHGKTVEYMGKISKSSLTESQTAELMRLMESVNSLENIGDIVETDLVGIGNKLIDEGVSISDETRKVLLEIHAAVVKSVDGAVQAVSQGSELASQAVTNMKDEIGRLVNSAAVHEAQRLVAEEPNRLAAYTIEVDLIEKLRRIYYFAKRMAKTVTPDLVLEKSA